MRLRLGPAVACVLIGLCRAVWLSGQLSGVDPREIGYLLLSDLPAAAALGLLAYIEALARGKWRALPFAAMCVVLAAYVVRRVCHGHTECAPSAVGHSPFLVRDLGRGQLREHGDGGDDRRGAGVRVRAREGLAADPEVRCRRFGGVPADPACATSGGCRYTCKRRVPSSCCRRRSSAAARCLCPSTGRQTPPSIAAPTTRSSRCRSRARRRTSFS